MTDSCHYSNNCALLKKYHPHIYEIINNSPRTLTGKVIQSQNGQPNLALQLKNGTTLLLHDQESPEKELGPFFELVPKDARGVVALLGMGLGYSALALSQERPYIDHLVVFELEPSVFLEAVHNLDLCLLLTDRRLTLHVGEVPQNLSEILAPMATDLQMETIHILHHGPSFQYNSGYDVLREELYSLANSHSIEGATKMIHGNDFIVNRLKHLSSIHHNYLLEDLQDTYHDIPAVIVAGGPSLNKNIHLLPILKDRAVIICVDTVLPALLGIGIQPNFVCSIDYREDTYEKFAHIIPEVQDKEIPLICTAWVTPKITKIFPTKNIFWSFSHHHIEQWINQMAGGSLVTPGAGSVAQANLFSAITMGCNPIIFVGQDLAYAEEQSHVANAVMTNQDQVERLLSTGEELIWVKGTQTEKVPTSRPLLSILKGIESSIAAHPRHYINATEGGAHIEGTEVYSLEDTITRFCTTPHKIPLLTEKSLLQRKPINPKKILAEINDTDSQVKNILELIKKSDKLIASSLLEIRKFQRAKKPCQSMASLPKAIQKNFAKIDKDNAIIDSHEKIWLLVQDISYVGIKLSQRMLHDIEKLLNKPGRFLDWLQGHLERFQYLNKARKEILDLFHENLEPLASHLSEEQRIGWSAGRSTMPTNIRLQLARLHFESGDLILAKPLLDELVIEIPASAEIHFFLGVIAAQQTEFLKAETLFARALQLDHAIHVRIQSFRQKWGDDYFHFAQRFLRFDRNPYRKMLFKGLCLCASHSKISKALLIMADELHTEIKSQGEEPSSKLLTSMQAWYNELEASPPLTKLLPIDFLLALHQTLGGVYKKQKKFDKSQQNFEKVLELKADLPETHIALTDIFFEQGNFTDGLNHLKKAVSLDPAYATYWEQIGDTIFADELWSDALQAYEHCFTALPHNNALLKKIGDCYLKMGQPEAALEAYSQLKTRFIEPSSTNKN